MSDLNVVHAAQLARVVDRGEPRRGAEQGELDLIADGAVAIRDGRVVAVGETAEVLRDWGDRDVPTIDATGRSVLPGLIECHSHPLFAGSRHAEYAKRLAGASLAEIAAAGGGIWASVLATRERRQTTQLTAQLAAAYRRILAGGVTTLEVKSGYGLTAETELPPARAAGGQPRAHAAEPGHLLPRRARRARRAWRPRPTPTTSWPCWRRVVAQGLADFHDVTCEAGLFTPAQALRMLRRSAELGILTRTHSDAWAQLAGLGDRGRRRRAVGRAPHLHARRGDPRRRRDRHGRGPAAPGRARLHDRPPRQRPAVHRHRRARRHRHRLLLLDPRHRR